MSQIDRRVRLADNAEGPRDERGRWTTDGGEAGAHLAGPATARPAKPMAATREPISYTTIPVASDRVYPWVTTFRDARLGEAIKLAAVIGHGVTADEVLAASGAECDYGRNTKATVHGNFFGIHSPGKNPANYLPGQIGEFPTTFDGPMAAFPVASGFTLSGLVFAKKMANHAQGKDLSNTDTFIALAHSLGWGATNKASFGLVSGAYQLLRNSARVSERRT